MDLSNNIKRTVKEKYSKIALNFQKGCCNTRPSCCSDSESIDFSMIGDEYRDINGYVADSDLGLGCGLPTEYAEIKLGDTVVDLGCGAGNDVFIARSIVGENGKVIGIDMTEEMIETANINNRKLGYTNVEFRLGDIEALPVADETADVVISNCVLNLVPDKIRAFSEIYRILKPGARFCISDIVIKGKLPEEFKKSAELFTGCISGALEKSLYLKIIKDTGFKKIEIKKMKKIELPNDLLTHHLSKEGIEDYKRNLKGVFSMTIVGHKSNTRTKEKINTKGYNE